MRGIQPAGATALRTHLRGAPMRRSVADNARLWRALLAGAGMHGRTGLQHHRGAWGRAGMLGAGVVGSQTFPGVATFGGQTSGSLCATIASLPVLG